MSTVVEIVTLGRGARATGAAMLQDDLSFIVLIVFLLNAVFVFCDHGVRPIYLVQYLDYVELLFDLLFALFEHFCSLVASEAENKFVAEIIKR